MGVVMSVVHGIAYGLEDFAHSERVSAIAHSRRK
jgi:hypothetical protein